MKKLTCALMAVMIIFTLQGCQKEVTDGQRFKQEYEALNGKTDESGSVLVDITVPDSSQVRYVSAEKMAEAIGNGTHVLYFGWPDCQWCRRMIPVLLKVMENYPSVSLYYYNMYSDRQAYQDDPESRQAQNYRMIIDELLKDEFDLSEYVGYFDDGIIKYPSSLILFIKEGEIVGAHKRTVDSHIDPYEPLNDEQLQQLSDIFDEYLKLLVSKVSPGCSDKCD